MGGSYYSVGRRQKKGGNYSHQRFKHDRKAKVHQIPRRERAGATNKSQAELAPKSTRAWQQAAAAYHASASATLNPSKVWRSTRRGPSTAMTVVVMLIFLSVLVAPAAASGQGSKGLVPSKSPVPSMLLSVPKIDHPQCGHLPRLIETQALPIIDSMAMKGDLDTGELGHEINRLQRDGNPAWVKALSQYMPREESSDLKKIEDCLVEGDETKLAEDLKSGAIDPRGALIQVGCRVLAQASDSTELHTYNAVDVNRALGLFETSGELGAERNCQLQLYLNNMHGFATLTTPEGTRTEGFSPDGPIDVPLVGEVLNRKGAMFDDTAARETSDRENLLRATVYITEKQAEAAMQYIDGYCPVVEDGGDPQCPPYNALLNNCQVWTTGLFQEVTGLDIPYTQLFDEQLEPRKFGLGHIYAWAANRTNSLRKAVS